MAGEPHVRLLQLFERRFRRGEHLADHPARFSTVHRRHDIRLKLLAGPLEPDCHAGDPRQQAAIANPGKIIPEEFNLHVLVAGLAHPFQQLADLLPPDLKLPFLQPIAHLQHRAQTPARDPPAVNIFDVLSRADAGKLIGQLPGLLAQITSREQSVAGNVRGFHQ